MLSKVILQAHIDKVETYFDRADKSGDCDPCFS